MPDEQSPEAEADDIKFSPWDRRVISAISVAESARFGVLVLRVSAAVVAGFAIIGAALALFSDIESQGVSFDQPVDRQTVGRFLAEIANPLAFAGIVLALSYLIQIAAARLDIDVVLSDEDESDRDDCD